MPVATAVSAEAEMEPGLLPSGPAAMAVHSGPYEELPPTYAAIEQWMEDNGVKPGGAPWESYVTDPGRSPNEERLRYRS